MPQASLEAIPNELLVQIAAFLGHHDLAQLNRTCKCINTLVQPRIWHSIELHTADYHESSEELSNPPPFIPISQRACHSSEKAVERYTRSHIQENKAEKLMDMLRNYHATNQGRLQELCSHVKNLCTGVDSNVRRHVWGKEGTSVWHLLPYFTNLETLELHGDPMDQFVEKITAAPLPFLRFAKLFAYIPREVAQWVIKSAPTLERLDIGLLDRPISSDLDNNPEFRPLTQDKLNQDSDGDSDYGSLIEDAVIPRPLGGFLPDDFDEDLPRLKVMHLLSTANTPDDSSFTEYGWSRRAEKASLKDWRRLLLASNETLETLVLEHRPGAEYIEGDGLCEEEWLKMNKDGNNNRALVHMVQKLLTDRTSFPMLKNVYLYGFAVGNNSNLQPGETTPGGRLMLDLENRGVQCEARLGKWCYFDGGPGYTFWCNWNGGDEDGGSDTEDKWDTILAQV
ncbi:hypothetical protein G7Z17_g3957 [Cylindrodendrum hubeiense]|uniref:F-box domain-containing protein n=1 Tax=Cylindrodendrum hubeiense TaxID=595255 RepID=A0A9P5H9P2_9HYPO|nr:hypothetical protein G7Z17_g3957 [Cylindrodendrum hubeiense]